jgi:CIC family chloride channel protein
MQAMSDSVGLRKALKDLSHEIEKKTGIHIDRLNDREILFLNTVAVFVGLATGYVSIGFRQLISFCQNLILQNEFSLEPTIFTNTVLGNWIYIIPPIGFLIVASITKWLAPEAGGHGVPEVIEALETKGGKIRARIVAVKGLASALTIASGGSTGKEGPIVQMGAASGSLLGQWFRMPPKGIKILLACGVASGMAASFNTPIAGVIFAIEIILRELKTKSFVPLVIATVLATVISRLHLGNEVEFFVPAYSLVAPVEILLYVGLGCLAGFLGVILTKTLYGVEDVFQKLPFHFTQKAILGGLLLSLMGYFYPQVFGIGYETITQTLRSSGELQTLLALVVVKMLAMSVTLACGASGGIFAPSLFIGAVFGGAYGILAHKFFPGMTADFGAYAIVGMAAVFASTSRATFTAIVILFEMTLEYSIILPLMLACVIADQVANLLSKETIFTEQLKRKNITYHEGMTADSLENLTVENIMTKKTLYLQSNASLTDVDMLLSNHSHTMYPVVNEQQQVTGYIIKAIFLKNKSMYSAKATAAEMQQPMDVWIYSTDSLLHALKVIQQTKFSRMIVVERDTKKLVGILSGKDLLKLSQTASS